MPTHRKQNLLTVAAFQFYGGYMEYRKATIDEAQLVCDIVQDTKARIYPHYYTQAVVDFFGRLHSIDNIKKDIAQ